jgi:hypothetical protein
VPAGWMVGHHLTSHPQYRNVEPVAQQGIELADAVHGPLDHLNVGVGHRKSVGDFPAGGQFEDVCNSYDVEVLRVTHSRGDGQLLTGVFEEALAPEGESDVAAVTH